MIRRWHRSGVTRYRAAAAMLLLSASVLATGSAQAQTGDVDAGVATCLVKPRRVIQLGSPVFGVLKAVLVDRAEVVKQGQDLARLNDNVEEVQAALDRFRAANRTQIEAQTVDLQWNQREFERRQKLAGNMFSKASDVDEIATKIELDKVGIRKAEADLAIARLESARSDAQLAQKTIKSPMNGVVTEIKLQAGEFIYEQTPIMTIAEIDPLTVDLVMPAERYKSLRVGMIGDLHLRPPVDATVPAKVDAIDPVIDPASDTFRVRLTLPNPGNAIPAGTRCSVRFPDRAASE